MKQKLLFLFLLSFSIVLAKPNEKKTTANPSIGILMSANNFGSAIFYTIKIKNIGEETLTNVFVTDPTNSIQFNFSTIATLEPGQEITNLEGSKFGFGFCYDQSQVMVHATASSTTMEISDLSSDPTAFDNNGLPGTYYNDLMTTSSYFIFVNGC